MKYSHIKRARISKRNRPLNVSEQNRMLENPSVDVNIKENCTRIIGNDKRRIIPVEVSPQSFSARRRASATGKRNASHTQSGVSHSERARVSKGGINSCKRGIVREGTRNTQYAKVVIGVGIEENVTINNNNVVIVGKPSLVKASEVYKSIYDSEERELVKAIATLKRK